MHWFCKLAAGTRSDMMLQHKAERLKPSGCLRPTDAMFSFPSRCLRYLARAAQQEMDADGAYAGMRMSSSRSPAWLPRLSFSTRASSAAATSRYFHQLLHLVHTANSKLGRPQTHQPSWYVARSRSRWRRRCSPWPWWLGWTWWLRPSSPSWRVSIRRIPLERTQVRYILI